MNIQESASYSNVWNIVGIIFIILLSIVLLIFVIYLKNKCYISEYLYHNRKNLLYTLKNL